MEKMEERMAKSAPIELEISSVKLEGLAEALQKRVDALTDEFIDALARRVIQRIRQIEREQGRTG